MHPEIEQFWINAGFLIDKYRPHGITSDILWCISWFGRAKGNVELLAISKAIRGREPQNIEVEKYYYNNKKYSEIEMLKLIKLKSFL